MNHHDVCAISDERESVGHRILPPRAAIADRDGRTAGLQIIRDVGYQVGRQCHDNLGDPVVQRERLDASLKNGSSAEWEKLLRSVAAKARASASGSNDGADMHEAAILPETIGETTAQVVSRSVSRR